MSRSKLIQVDLSRSDLKLKLFSNSSVELERPNCDAETLSLLLGKCVRMELRSCRHLICRATCKLS